MEVLAKAIVVILVVVKNLPAMQETGVQSLGQEDPLKKEMATHFSILAWEIQWTEEPGGGLQSTGSQESDMSSWLNLHHPRVVITLQHLSVSDQHLVLLKLTQCYMSIIRQWKQERKRKNVEISEMETQCGYLRRYTALIEQRPGSACHAVVWRGWGLPLK